MFDLIIRNGVLIDGTRAPRRTADIGVVGDRIEAVGNLATASAKSELTAAGRIVAPGFIDVHNHSDGWLTKISHLTPKTLQGFTTELLMVDGISYAPVNQDTVRQWIYYLRGLDGLRMDDYRGWHSINDFMQILDRRNVQNVAAHIPYANVRTLVAGFGNRVIDDFQMRQIEYQIRSAMEEGAVGLSTGLDYIAQCFATTEELVAACRAMSDMGGIYVSHVRYKKGLLPALEEACEIGRRAGVAVHISHLKVQESAPVERIFEFLERARRDVDITFDVYPYQPGSTMLNYLLPYDAWEDGPLAATSLLDTPDLRRKFRQGIEAYRLDLNQIRIAWVPGRENVTHQGRSLDAYVRQSGRSVEDALLDLLLEERLAVLCVMHEGDDELVMPLLAHDLYMMGTDGIYFPDAQVHPRMYGSTGRLLGSCVRDRRLFSLEDAIYKLSGFPAGRFGLRRRGVIKEGNYADLVVFDAKTINDPATLDAPNQLTVGIEHVLVNGQSIVSEGRPVEIAGKLPGRYLRYRC